MMYEAAGTAAQVICVLIAVNVRYHLPQTLVSHFWAFLVFSYR
jgi:hypothetical protein